MSRPPTDEDMDLMLGYQNHQPTLADLERKIDVLGLKLDKIKSELTAFGIGVFVVLVLHYFWK